MLAVFVNMGTVLLGSAIGLLFGSRINQKYMDSVMAALALITIVIGISSAVATENVLAVIICLVLGTLMGELLRIDDGIEGAGDFLKRKVLRGKLAESRFTEAFVSASILFCVGSMSIMGSLSAGLDRDYSIIFAKSALDLVSAIVFSAGMGVGVAFAALFILVYQGALTLLAGLLGPYLSAEVVTEISAVGGTILIGMGINMLDLAPKRIRVANMLPAIFLPILYFPVSAWLSGVLG